MSTDVSSPGDVSNTASSELRPSPNNKGIPEGDEPSHAPPIPSVNELPQSSKMSEPASFPHESPSSRTESPSLSPFPTLNEASPAPVSEVSATAASGSKSNGSTPSPPSIANGSNSTDTSHSPENQNPNLDSNPAPAPLPANMFKLDAPPKRKQVASHPISSNDSADILTKIINKATVELDFEGAKFSDVFARTLAEASAALAENPRVLDPKLLVGGKLEVIPEKETNEDDHEEEAEDGNNETIKTIGLFTASHFALLMMFLSLLMLFLGTLFSILSAANAISRTVFKSEFFFFTIILLVSNLQMYYSFMKPNIFVALNFLLISFLLDIGLMVQNLISILEENDSHTVSSRVKICLVLLSFFNFLLSIFVFLYFKPVTWKLSHLVSHFSKTEKITQIGSPHRIDIISQ